MKTTSGSNCLAIILGALLFMASPLIVFSFGPTAGGTGTSSGTGGSYSNTAYMWVCKPGSRIYIARTDYAKYYVLGYRGCL